MNGQVASEKVVEIFPVQVLWVGVDIKLTLERVQLFQTFQIAPGHSFSTVATEIYRTQGGHLAVTFDPCRREFTIVTTGVGELITAVRCYSDADVIILDQSVQAVINAEISGSCERVVAVTEREQLQEIV